MDLLQMAFRRFVNDFVMVSQKENYAEEVAAWEGVVAAEEVTAEDRAGVLADPLEAEVGSEGRAEGVEEVSVGAAGLVVLAQTGFVAAFSMTIGTPCSTLARSPSQAPSSPSSSIFRTLLARW